MRGILEQEHASYESKEASKNGRGGTEITQLVEIRSRRILKIFEQQWILL
jgi:hypothetical protein